MVQRYKSFLLKSVRACLNFVNACLFSSFGVCFFESSVGQHLYEVGFCPSPHHVALFCEHLLWKAATEMVDFWRAFFISQSRW